MVLVAVEVPPKKKTWNLFLGSLFQINHAFGFENQIWLWSSFEWPRLEPVVKWWLPFNYPSISIFFLKHFGPSSKHEWNMEPGFGSYLVPLRIPVPKLVLKIRTEFFFNLLNGTKTKIHILTSQTKFPPLTSVQTNVVRVLISNVKIKFSGSSFYDLDLSSHLFVATSTKIRLWN